MKTQCTDFDNVSFSFDGDQCLLCIGKELLMPEMFKFTAVLSKFKISRSTIQDSILLISKAVIKESLGADLDVKSLIMLLTGYALLFKESFFHLPMIEFSKKIFGHRIPQHELTYN